MELSEETYSCQPQEFKAIMDALSDHPMALKLFPELSAEAIKQRFLAYDGIRAFQSDAMYRATQFVIRQTIGSFTCSGPEYLDGRPALFISNHRDIVVDSLLLQYQLLSLGHDTTHIVIGSNLFEMPLMAQMAKVNKMIAIPRTGGLKAYYSNLMQLSTLLRSLITLKGQSVWIAQRNGRTKDGIDHTDPALIKMIAATGSDPVHALADMNIVPLSISYQWEPCAPLKARELCLRSRGPYQKAPGEDSQSIVSGITEYKGDVHLAVCPPLTLSELQSTQGHPDQVAALVDSRINQAYKMFDTNQMAARLLQSDTIADFPQAEQFNHYIEQACLRYPLGPEYRQTLLSIYANPLKNVLPC